MGCAVLCCAVLCCAVLCCAVLCCAVLCCAVLCCAVLCCAVLCCAVRATYLAATYCTKEHAGRALSCLRPPGIVADRQFVKLNKSLTLCLILVLFAALYRYARAVSVHVMHQVSLFCASKKLYLRALRLFLIQSTLLMKMMKACVPLCCH